MSNVSEDEKEKAIIHVDKEFRIFDICYKKLKKGLKGPRKRVYLESFLLHARNLYEFLCKSKGNYIKVVDFSVYSFSINKRDVFIPEINNQLSHMTYTRLKPKDLFIEKEKIYNIIKDALIEYNKKVPNKYKLLYVK